MITYPFMYISMYIEKTKSLFFLFFSDFLPPTSFFFFLFQTLSSLRSMDLIFYSITISNLLRPILKITLRAFLQLYLVDSEFCIKIILRNPSSQLQSDYMLSAICWICIVLLAPAATPYKAPTIRSPTTYHENYPT